LSNFNKDISSPNSNKISLYDLPKELYDILFDAEKYEILSISEIQGVRIFRGNMKGGNLEKLIHKIHNDYKNIIEKELLLFIIHRLNNPGQKWQKTRINVSFNEILGFYNKIKSQALATTTTTKTKTPSSFRKDEKIRGNHSTPPSKVDPCPSSEKSEQNLLEESLTEGQRKFKIFISPIPRDHNIRLKSKLDSNGDLFKEIVNNFQLKFNNKSSYEIINKNQNKQYYFVIWKSGAFNFQAISKMSIENALSQLINDFIFLKYDLYVQFIQIFKDILIKFESDDEALIETANAIGPSKYVENYLKDGHISIKITVDDVNTQKIIDVKIDNSNGTGEIDFRGERLPTKALQEIVSAPKLVISEFLKSRKLVENIDHKFDHIEIDLDQKFNEIILQNKEILHQNNQILNSIHEDKICSKSDMNQKLFELALQINAVATGLKENTSIIQELVQSFEKLEYEIIYRNSDMNNFMEDIKKIRRMNEKDLHLIDKRLFEIENTQDQIKNDMKDAIFENTEEILHTLGHIDGKLTEHSFFDTIQILIGQALSHQKLLQQIKSNKI
jgi:hypothetical protein